MNIDNLTVGQLKEVAAIAATMGLIATEKKGLYSPLLGKYALVRSRNEGINAGYVESADETGVVLKEARRIWYHRPADETAWYEGVANSGLHQDSKISAKVPLKAIIEDYSITLCSETAKKSIEGFKSHEQS